MPTATELTAYTQLIGRVGGVIPPAVAQELVQQAWKTICAERDWSFLFAEGYLIAPGAFSGTVTFTRGSKTFTPDSALQVEIETPSETRLVGIGKLAIRIGGEIYQIRSYDSGTHTGELDRIWLGSDGDSEVTIFRQYFTAPITEMESGIESGNFRSWVSIVDKTTSQPLNFKHSYGWVNLRDPKRSTTGTPVMVVVAPYDLLGKAITTTGPLFEFWPHYIGSEDKIFHCRFIRQYTPLSMALGNIQAQLPDVISLKYLTAQARLAAYEWAAVNVETYPQFKAVKWDSLIQLVMAEIQDEFLKARRTDEDRAVLYLDDNPKPAPVIGYSQGTAPSPFLYYP